MEGAEAAAELVALGRRAVKPSVNMQMAETQPYKVQPRAIPWEAVVVVAGLAGHLLPLVQTPNMVAAAEVAQDMVTLIVRGRMAARPFTEGAVAQVAGKKAGTLLGPLEIGEVIPLAQARRLVVQTKQV